MKKHITIILAVALFCFIAAAFAKEKNSPAQTQQVILPADTVFVTFFSSNDPVITDPNIIIYIGGKPFKKPVLPRTYDLHIPMLPNENSIMFLNPREPQKTTYITLSERPTWLAYNPEADMLYISSGTEKILVYDMKNNDMLGALEIDGYATDMRTYENLLYISVMREKPAILILDCIKNKFIKKIDIDKIPNALALSQDGKTLYCAAKGKPGSVYSISPSSGEKIGRITAGDNPYDLCIAPDGKTLYASNLGSGTISVIDTAGFKLKTTVRDAGVEPFKMVITPDGKKLYITCRKSDRVNVIDTNLNKIIKNIKTGAGSSPAGIAITKDGKYIYAANTGSKTISVIDTDKDIVVKSTTAQTEAQPFGVAVK